MYTRARDGVDRRVLSIFLNPFEVQRALASFARHTLGQSPPVAPAPPARRAPLDSHRRYLIEVGRLAILLRNPAEFVQRRVEHLQLADDHHYAVTMTQEFTVPSHGPPSEADADTNLLVPVGYFGKPRLADLEVRGSDDSILPVLGRSERGALTAVIFMVDYERTMLETVPEQDHEEVRAVIIAIQNQIAKIATAPADEAKDLTDKMMLALETDASESFLTTPVRQALGAIRNNPDFEDGVRSFERSRLVIARMRGRPGRTYAVRVDHTERLSYELERGRARSNGHVRSIAWRNGVRWVLALIGWSTVGIHREAANFGKALSHWIIQTVPDGVEPIRQYWDDQGDTHKPLDDESVENDRAVTARYRARSELGKVRNLILEVQMAPSPAVMSAALLAIALCAVATFIFQSKLTRHGADIQASLVSLATIFAAVPAAIAGALAYRGQTFVRRMSRGPRFLLALLSLQAAALSVEISLKRVTQTTARLSLVLAVYSFFVAGVFAYIQLGPRWRKSMHSRWRSRVSKRSPRECAFRQARSAAVAFVLLVFATVVFFRCQEALRYKHFFSHHFPTNIWRAWWSWF